MASALQLKNKDSITIRSKSLQKKVDRQTANTLRQLLMRPNITIKKSIILDNYKAQNSKKLGQPAKLPVTTQTFETAKSLLVPQKEIEITNVDRSRSLLISENTEYYPDKHKRNVQTKKIVLQPKHDYSVVATTNKRKRRKPHKEIKSCSPTVLDSAPDTEMSIEELVRMADEQGMDDEDFMEILTCPSPVWWEDDEEESRIRFQANIDEEHYGKHENESEISHECLKGKSLKSDINFFKKFVQKRSKLETVLGKIKYKKTEHEVSNKDSINNEIGNKVRKNSTGGLSDASINEEELLYSLENIEIPVQDVEDTDGVENNATINKEPNKRNTIKKKSNLNKIRKKKKQTRKQRKHFNNKTNKEVTKENEIKSNVLNEKDAELVPADLPPLTKNPFRNNPEHESKSIVSIIEPTSSRTIEFDSISDTNVRFLDEFLDEKTNTNKINDKNTTSNDFITVYNVITDNVDVEEQIKVNMLDKTLVKTVSDNSNSDNEPVKKARKTKKCVNEDKQIKFNLVNKPFFKIVSDKSNSGNEFAVKSNRIKKKCVNEKNKIKNISVHSNSKIVVKSTLKNKCLNEKGNSKITSSYKTRKKRKILMKKDI